MNDFTWRLAFLPIEVMDYIVVQELCHVIHKNHQQEFWNLVYSLCPEIKDQFAFIPGPVVSASDVEKESSTLKATQNTLHVEDIKLSAFICAYFSWNKQIGTRADLLKGKNGRGHIITKEAKKT